MDRRTVMMTSEERARKFWHDWYNGDAPGDLKMGDAMVGDDDVAELIALIDAVREEEREAAATYLLDRADQYKTTSPCWVAVSDCAEAVARGEASESLRTGDTEDLLSRVRRMAGKNRTPLTREKIGGQVSEKAKDGA